MVLRVIESLRSKRLFLIRRRTFVFIVVFLFLILGGAWLLSRDVQAKYEASLSQIVYDRTGVPLSIKENGKGHYVHPVAQLPTDFAELLIQKEDRYFYYHPGVNPISSLRAVFHYLTAGETGGASTISQQLVKNLLGNETARTVVNKLTELLYALGLELFTTKDELLLMYANTVYLGNQVQGFDTASRAYFDKPLAETTPNEQLALLATLSHPSSRNPWEEDNATYAAALSERLGKAGSFVAPPVTARYSFQRDSYFELRTAGVACVTDCFTTIDDTVTATIRTILNKHIAANWSRNIKNGAVVVIDAKTAELLAFIGTRDPKSDHAGDQINMALAPRPIGSTIKPFIYAAGFSKGLRPYSLVEDREYRYPIATGYSLYPKNYDGQYRGEMTLHEALSNSFNVPSVKVLEYVGLEHFYTFLSSTLGFQPIQDYSNYQYGIALGGLEMDLLTLTHYFTVFPANGFLQPLRVLQNEERNFDLPPQAHISDSTQVIDPPYIELVHTIISDRFTGVDQFGVNGNLTLSINNYGVKTGTSRDYHDSWVVGYTPDLVVGVWLGNSENTALAQVSGATGAGAVWHDVMEYLATTPYYSDRPFTPTHLETFLIEGNAEWGLRGDEVAAHRTILQEDNLILSIHEGDSFELTDKTAIPLRARKVVAWSVNDTPLGVAKETTFTPTSAGTYEVFAFDADSGVRESLRIKITTHE